jgi:hypothetical protein
MTEPLAANRSLLDRHALIDSALTNPETFRQTVQNAMRNFLPRERALVAPLTKYGFDPTILFDAWNSELRDQRASLIASRDSATFQRSIAKHLLLSTSQSGATVDRLVKQRDAELVELFVEHLFPIEKRRSRYHQIAAHNILRMSDSSLASLIAHYNDAAMAVSVGEEYSITSIDPHASFLRRAGSKQAIRRERRALYAQESRRLTAIRRQQKHLSRLFDGLVGTLFNLPIEYVVITAARQNFHKALLKQPDQDTVALATTVSRRVVEELLAVLPLELSQNDRHAQATQLEEIVWKIIQRSTVEVNQIMAALKELRELRDEQETIETNRGARRAVIAR